MLISKRVSFHIKRKRFEYLILCESCGKEEWLIGKKCSFGKKKFCSYTCINSGRKHSEESKNNLSIKSIGVNNPFYGQKHKPETIERILKTKIQNNTLDAWNLRKEKLSEEDYQQWYNNYCESVSGENNSFYGKHHTDETKKHLSEVKAQLISDGTIELKTSHYGLKGYYYSSKMNEMFRYDSLIELLRMKMLDLDNEIISWTKRHGIRISYLFDQQIKQYVPDFLITKNSSIILEELKGYEDENKKQAKFKTLKEYCDKNNLIANILTYDDISKMCKIIFKKSIYTLRKRYHEGKLFNE